MLYETGTELRIPDEHICEKMKNDLRSAAYRADDPRETAFAAVYYDTPEHIIDAKKRLFYSSAEGGGAVWVFKGEPDENAGLFTRKRYFCEADNLAQAVERLLAAGTPEESLAAGAYAESCKLSATRLSCTLNLPEDTVALVAIDRGVIAAGGKTEPFSELRLELFAGPPAPLAAFAGELAARYDLEKELLSKYARALRLQRTR
ncbi:MAG: hypothetical protein LBI44_00905 [Oscillospiraceae bacterium]|jgi:inorganic triphosphatase YgiF|nr:hypothetical protein [Oscillospiraceae bacterium]